jgi:hypothetical protein
MRAGRHTVLLQLFPCQTTFVDQKWISLAVAEKFQ